MGRKSCDVHYSNTIFTPDEDSNDESMELPSSAGVWTSRFMADSEEGTTYLCHTLKPNVSADFSDR